MNIRHLTFRLLQVYVQVVRSGSISAAARSLHLTQPTVSLQLKKLSDAVGEPLLRQREGRYEMTDAGAELFRASLDVLQRFEEVGSFLGEARAGRSGRLSIGLVTTAKYVMPRILGPFSRQFPNVEVALHIGNRAHILERFNAMEDDLYLFSHPPAGTGVQATRIIRNPLQLIAALDHWAVHREHLNFSDLAEERFLIREPGSATRLMFEFWLSAHGHELHKTMQIESNEAIRFSVASGLGLSVISAHTLEEGREKLAVLTVPGFPLESNWYLVRNADRRMPYAAGRLIEFMASHLQDCIERDWVAPDIANLLDHFP
jgi:LysR family transcriptional regulator, low CO2-responsive transcriptional regulator